MGGEELAEKFSQINPKIKILLCSGYTESRIFIHGQPDKDRYFFITKPYSLVKLHKKIRQILDH
jgi:two-component SAPR family response regulator